MLKHVTLLSALLFSLPMYSASSLKKVELRDLHLGEVFYYAHQGRYFDALARLDTELLQHYTIDEQKLGSLYAQLGQAEFSVGDIEIQYRMHLRAGKAIQAVLGQDVDLASRNQAALSLAQVFHKKNDPQSALYALDMIHEKVDASQYETVEDLGSLVGETAANFNANADYLRALSYIKTGQFSQAITILKSLKSEKSLEGFVLYNLGIALTHNQQPIQAAKIFDQLGQLSTDDKTLLALKDKANLKLAYLFLEKGETQNDSKLAQKYFERVRLDALFSNQALLGTGWAAVAQGQFKRALVPWSLLHKRVRTDDAVQEALMAVPYAYGKLEAYGKAANLYNYAVNVFANEISSLDDSIKSIRKGTFLTALVDKRSLKDENWIVNLRELPDTPETHYILDLMAANNFQEFYKNYKDLAELRDTVDKSLTNLVAYEEIIEIRRAYLEPMLPAIETKFKKIDGKLRLRLEQRDNLAKKLDNMLISPRPEYLATSGERYAMDKILALKNRRAIKRQAEDSRVMQRIKRLLGILSWRLNSQYDQRLTDAFKNLIALDEVIEKEQLAYNAFVRTRQAATQSYEGYSIPIRQLRTRLFSAQRQLQGIMAKQGRLIETMAINELDRRRKKLEAYQVKARFALAENYDRAMQAQNQSEIEQLQQLQEKMQLEKATPKEKQEALDKPTDKEKTVSKIDWLNDNNFFNQLVQRS